jgi:HAMP domain-containing protein
MKILYALLALSVAAVLVSGLAMWWRLRRHLRRPDAARTTVENIQPEHRQVE